MVVERGWFRLTGSPGEPPSTITSEARLQTPITQRLLLVERILVSATYPVVVGDLNTPENLYEPLCIVYDGLVLESNEIDRTEMGGNATGDYVVPIEVKPQGFITVRFVYQGNNAQERCFANLQYRVET